MASPFPGMDPYLETPALWSDFHASFVTYWREALSECLPDNYEARIDEKVSLVEIVPPRKKLIEPDIALTQSRSAVAFASAPTGVATLDPVTLSLVIEEETARKAYRNSASTRSHAGCGIETVVAHQQGGAGPHALPREA